MSPLRAIRIVLDRSRRVEYIARATGKGAAPGKPRNPPTSAQRVNINHNSLASVQAATSSAQSAKTWPAGYRAVVSRPRRDHLTVLR
jgi:hypothetical protein